MKGDWNPSAKLCGNCQFWALANYQHDFKGAPPLGAGGHHCDGTVSDCRRHAPVAVLVERHPSANRVFPTTEREETCGEFKARPRPPSFLERLTSWCAP